MNPKRLYFDMRLGQVFVFPIISMINFIVITHTLTPLGSSVPLQVYVPAVIASLLVALVGIGYVYRRIQQSTDHTMHFERNPKMVEALYALLSDDPVVREKEREYLKRVLEKQ